jgi:hypothetical protein
VPGTYKCDYLGCISDDAMPIFTAPMSSITKKAKTRQPKWRCEKHRKGLHRVSPTSGERVRAFGGLHRNRTELKEVRRNSGEAEEE